MVGVYSPKYYLNPYLIRVLTFIQVFCPRIKGALVVPGTLLMGSRFQVLQFMNYLLELMREIFSSKNISIHPEETAYSLYHKIQASVSQSFPTFIDAFIKQRIKPTFQSNEHSSYYPRKLPYNGLIDLSWDNDKVDRFIRAMIFPPFDPAKLILNNKIHMVTTLNQYNQLLSCIK